MKFAVIFLFLLSAACCQAQNDPSFRQFYFNPFHFNPAYTGIDGYTDIYFSTRKQWIDFKDAPLFSQFSAQYATRKRLSLGFLVTDQEVVALQNTFISAAFAYRVPLTKKKSLIFGISGGVGVSNLDLGNYDYSNDPTILNAATTSVYGNASFGAVYVWNRLRVGFALPQLFGQQYISPQKLGSRNFSQLQKQNYSVSYKFSRGSFSFSPWFLLRLSNDYQNTWDGGTTIAFRDKIWLGSSYNNQQGPAFFVGMEIKEILKIGYSYELPPANNGFIQTRSMEFQVRIRLNPKKYQPTNSVGGREEMNEPDAVEQVVKFSYQPKKEEVKPVETKPMATDKTDSSAIKPLAKIDSVTNRNTVKVDKDEIVKEKTVSADGTPLLKNGLYLVTGSFRNPTNAGNQKDDLKRKGFSETAISFNEKTGLYLVHVFYSQSKEEAQKMLNQFQIKGLKSCFLLSVR